METLVRRTVADRLEGWLTLHDRHWPPKGEWNRLAAEIGVMPEALYREIAKCIRVEQLLPVPGRANGLDRLNSTARNTV